MADQHVTPRSAEEIHARRHQLSLEWRKLDLEQKMHEADQQLRQFGRSTPGNPPQMVHTRQHAAYAAHTAVPQQVHNQFPMMLQQAHRPQVAGTNSQRLPPNPRASMLANEIKVEQPQSPMPQVVDVDSNGSRTFDREKAYQQILQTQRAASRGRPTQPQPQNAGATTQLLDSSNPNSENDAFVQYRQMSQAINTPPLNAQSIPQQHLPPTNTSPKDNMHNPSPEHNHTPHEAQHKRHPSNEDIDQQTRQKPRLASPRSPVLPSTEFPDPTSTTSLPAATQDDSNLFHPAPSPQRSSSSDSESNTLSHSMTTRRPPHSPPLQKSSQTPPQQPSRSARTLARRPPGAYTLPAYGRLPLPLKQHLEQRWCAHVARMLATKSCIHDAPIPLSSENLWTRMRRRLVRGEAIIAGRVRAVLGDDGAAEAGIAAADDLGDGEESPPPMPQGFGAERNPSPKIAAYLSANDFESDVRAMLMQYVRMGACANGRCPYAKSGNSRVMCWRMRLEGVMDEKMKFLKRCLKECEDGCAWGDLVGMRAVVDAWWEGEFGEVRDEE